MLYDELLDYLQNLTRRKITQQDMGEALDISKQAIGKKKADSYNFKAFEIEKIKDYIISKYNVIELSQVDNNLQIDVVKIPYWDKFPEEMKNPQYPFVVATTLFITLVIFYITFQVTL